VSGNSAAGLPATYSFTTEFARRRSNSLGELDATGAPIHVPDVREFSEIELNDGILAIGAASFSGQTVAEFLFAVFCAVCARSDVASQS
jgi:hypothetical protein